MPKKKPLSRRSPRKTSPPSAAAEGSGISWWYPAVVGLVALACYIQSAGFDFVYDDNVQIVTNLRIRSFSNLGAAFRENFWAFNTTFTNYYRPLQTLTYMIAYSMGGLEPGVYHWINIVLHLGATLLVFWIGWLLFQNGWVALWGGILFAVHPMHAESVAWIAGVTDVGCALFLFASLAAYLKFRATGRQKNLWLAVSLVSFLAALLFKETALTFPVALLILKLSDRRESAPPWKTRIQWWCFYLAVLVVYLILRIQALGAFSRAVNPMPITLADRILTTLYFLARYLQKLVLPVAHNAFYVFEPFSRLSVSDWLPPLFLLILAAWFGWKYLKSEGKLWFLLGWVIVALIPVLSLTSVGRNVFTERYLYISSLGVCLLIPALVDRYLEQFRRPATLALAGIAALLGWLTIQRAAVWRDDRTLYTTTLAVSPDAAPFHLNLGIHYFRDRNLPAARHEFVAGLQADSKMLISSPQDRYNALLGLSSVASAEGQLDEARKYAEEARDLMPHLGEAYRTLGGLMARQGQYGEAEKLLRRALQINPSNASAHQNLGNILMVRNELAAAEREYRTAMELDPRSSETRIALGFLLSQTNRNPEALAVLRAALDLEPNNEQVRAAFQQISSGKRPSADVR
jgi:tetratricopeptide (TPR) repeat protein